MILSLATDFIIPILMITVGVIFTFKPPQNINSLYGYRSPRSQSSQESWNYSQKLLGTYSLQLGVLLLFVNILVALLSPYSSNSTSLFNAIIGIIVLILPIILIEKKLRAFASH